MNPIIDTNMLKHHRIDYGPRVDYDTRQRAPKPRSSKLALATWVPLFLIVGLGFWGA